ncbi:uncharacterized protein LOC113769843 [Coffea eugenioides]|uniref:uncharacterized protein LOC113769843 n=1 Tax=Coffea eugenioides TaxID=49369 RepID=UPI000F60E5B4|nr:uncharacterized protein LOC113769843 [Coffea eugenioides]
MRKFGFGERFIDMVWRLVSNVWFSVLINGSSYGFFKSSRGLRQGDTLSPVLFVIGAEVLSRGLNSLVTQPRFRGFTVPRRCVQVTHLAFADDVIIFANGSSEALKLIMRILAGYQGASGQLINAQKCGYLMHPSTSPARRRVVKRLTGFSRQYFPILYLGFPLYFGRGKATHYGEVCQAILGRVLSWKSKFIPPRGEDSPHQARVVIDPNPSLVCRCDAKINIQSHREGLFGFFMGSEWRGIQTALDPLVSIVLSCRRMRSWLPKA